MDVQVLLSHEKINHQHPQPVYLMVGLTPPEVDEEARSPIDVVIALDTSGSMKDPATGNYGPNKLALAKIAVRRFVEQLRPGDRVGLLTFASEVTVVAPPQELTSEHRTALLERVAKLTPNGGTDLASGALKSLGLMAELPATGKRTRRVIVFTDGLPTVGILEQDQIVTAIGSANIKHTTPITTMGFGAAVVHGVGEGGYNPDLLTALAQGTTGNFYHAEGEDGILGAFAAELGALRSVAATMVRVEIEPLNGVMIKRVLNDFKVAAKDGVTAVEVGNLYGGETQYVLAELAVPPAASPGSDKHHTLAAQVTVKLVEVNEGPVEVEMPPVPFTYALPAQADTKPNPAVETERVRLEAAKAVEQAFYLAAQGNYAAAQRTVMAFAAAAAAVGTDDSAVVEESLMAMAADFEAPKFEAHRGALRAASSGLGSRHYTGSPYTDKLKSPAQRKADTDLGVKPPPPPPAPKK